MGQFDTTDDSDPAIDHAWTEVKAAEDALAAHEDEATASKVADAATAVEKKRCFDVVAGEVAKGQAMKLPATSGVMVILARISAAINN